MLKKNFLSVFAIFVIIFSSCEDPTTPKTKKSNLDETPKTDEIIWTECTSFQQIQSALDAETGKGDTPDNPVYIALSGVELTASNFLSLIKVCSKYVALNLSDCGGQTLGALNLFDTAYDRKSNIVYIILPESILSLGFSTFGVMEEDADAFRGFVNLKKIEMPGVLFIAGFSFGGCVKLENVIAPSVTNIKQDAFIRCESLKTIEIGDAVPKIDSLIFNSCAIREMEIKFMIPDSARSVYNLEEPPEPEEDEEEEETDEEVDNSVNMLSETAEISWLTKLGENKDAGNFWDENSLTQNNLKVSIEVLAE
ncbi:MAG: leucine-rich repeat domain-containing protein [Spirochaetaceae bacterium]|jgi:hypothetical protein|nr:leucine-rich repeat domain-containing protein [Spirochaetaceae bacterium]